MTLAQDEIDKGNYKIIRPLIEVTKSEIETYNKNNKLKVEYEKVLSDLNDTQTELRNTKIELDNKNTINTEKEE